jgi:antitoxin (DNA-binding transcriptional repressor) of toxin-antitoxin stability system
MKTATVRDLRNRFHRVSKWLESGEPVQILKRGRRFARVVPEPRKGTFLNACPAPQPLPDDVDEPVDVAWDARE